ncbi:hypothetical protein Nepgr_023706 [Nepenthes gracilis]|uniref:Uncharacterized protein n=1 Tax=Nepenthes gracilis TaxID=150966 RepID=A0AAD3T2M0_NEPGR|nr:hypothetical protein Nepgr_023706 [Nepenthes gracilis]
MEIFNCFSAMAGRKKKDKRDGNILGNSKNENGVGTLQVKLEHPVKTTQQDESYSTSFCVSVPFSIPENSSCEVKIMTHDSCIEKDTMDANYEGEDECDVKSQDKRDKSNCNPQAHICQGGMGELQLANNNMNPFDYFSPEAMHFEGKNEKDAADDDLDMIQSGHVSDPGMTMAENWVSPMLKRSCSSLETREVIQKIVNQLPPSKSLSFEELQELAEKAKEDVFPWPGSPYSNSSAMTHHSADKVVLKKRSSSQILPSRSRRLWWKLFLWSHRNMQKPRNDKSRPVLHASLNQLGGYSSDTLEMGRVKELSKSESPASFSEYPSNQRGGFEGRISSLWPQNQWVAFSVQPSPFQRVDEWVKDLKILSSSPADDGEDSAEDIEFPPSPETGKSVSRSTAHLTQHPKPNLSDDVLHANSVIQSLNSSSTVAHISGMGLRVIPTISHFWRLRSINLSSNNIDHITAGSLPKGLHILDLSRNKISSIGGLRELTRLRVLNLSYNRISRVGHGLSDCTLLKELYLAGNKISDVEGLHRLLKLTVLDLSFNKITTTKALGQLVANYNSLVGLNLLGNPMQSNLSDDQLRKAVCGLLPKLAYLNRQLINQQKAREVAMDSVAKASLGNSSLSCRRRAVKKVGQGAGSLSSSATRSNASIGQRSRNKLKSRSHHHHCVLKTSSSEMPSSSHKHLPLKKNPGRKCIH